MIKSKVLANAVGTITGAVFIICRLVAGIVPNFLFNIGQSWFHTINLEADQVGASMTFGMFVLGLVSSVAVAWVVAYAVAELYNRWAKE